LPRVERPERPGRQGEQWAAAALQFHRIAGEIGDLAMAEVDDGAAAGLQPVADFGPARGIAQGREPDQGHGAADAHQHIGVIDRPPGRIDRVEDHRLEVEMRAETLGLHVYPDGIVLVLICLIFGTVMVGVGLALLGYMLFV